MLSAEMDAINRALCRKLVSPPTDNGAQRICNFLTKDDEIPTLCQDARVK
jgi:hypothetical protein